MLTVRQRVSWLRHLATACLQQHHQELTAIFQPLIRPSAVIVDVGAHAGQFAKLFSQMAPEGQVFAFEPSPYARSILERALTWNRIQNVKVVPTGLSDAEGEATLSTPIKSRGGIGFGLASLAGASGDRRTTTHSVPLQTLDGFAERSGVQRVDFLKADVEGWEAHVLRGGKRTIEQHRPALYLEVAEDALARAGSSPGDIWSELAPLGYEALRAPDFEPVAAFTGTGDYLFVPARMGSGFR
ncbi:MAG: FkbM family methyltransferase [Phenylobacterium sp.]|uniref:FkbM family methyltransferase n=1 Tax=Phenylobacterium sp. TaxID=1871053 RepID=UPI002715DF3C|nr:FkbM family methyltransferase [Phenylobacterium sp.]MDO8409514.1 FkbM family methyltransferase [Phenylobacterium sp.]